MSEARPALTADESLGLPEIVAERCVHSLMEQASCRSCVDVCPSGAWALEDDCLGIDPEKCDNCGLCAAVCTEGALLHQHEPLTGEWKNRRLALIACDRQSLLADEPRGVIPCLHSLGLRDVLALYRRGYRTLCISSADCDCCSRGAAQRLEGRIADVNGWLERLGLENIWLRRLDAGKWLRISRTIEQPPVAGAFSRRRFLGRAISEVIDKAIETQTLLEHEQTPFEAPAEMLALDEGSACFPFTPVIDIERCSACHACAALCPHQALIRENAESPAYRIDAWKCSGCRLCVDVCRDSAIEVHVWSVARRKRIPLVAHRCRSCGATCYRTRPTHAERCPVCEATAGENQLFQVLD